jgi:hypothetical protein
VNPRTIALDERRLFLRATLDRTNVRLPKLEQALRTIMLLTDSREVFNLAAEALSEEG